MSGHLLFNKNANAESCASEMPPVGDWSDAGLEVCLLTGALGYATRNLARGKPDGIFSAVPPLQGAGYLTFLSPTKYIETSIPDTDEGTVLIAVRTAGASGSTSVFCGTFNGDSVNHPGFTSQGMVAFQSNTAASAHLQVGFWDGSAPETVDAIPGLTLSSWQLLIGRYGAGGVKFQNMTTPAGSTVATAHARLRNVNTLQIGSAPTAITPATATDIALFMLWSRQIGDSEMTPVYAQMKAYLAAKGITV
jgi:hypothetical protein